MTRILRRPSFDNVPIDVPAPPSWDAVAVAAYEQGFEEGGVNGREQGRRELRELDAQLLDAVDRCIASVDAATEAMAGRVLDVSELFVTTALRHTPEAGTYGLLVRLGEVLRTFEPGPVELSVANDLVDDLQQIIAARSGHVDRVTVVGDHSLAPGEFRLHSEWADADGTFDRYLEAARDALELNVAGDQR
jgi:flagellar assembly protein FliH